MIVQFVECFLFFWFRVFFLLSCYKLSLCFCPQNIAHVARRWAKERHSTVRVVVKWRFLLIDLPIVKFLNHEHMFHGICIQWIEITVCQLSFPFTALFYYMDSFRRSVFSFLCQPSAFGSNYIIVQKSINVCCNINNHVDNSYGPTWAHRNKETV